MEKFYEENCLYEQHYIKDESVTIGEMIAQAIAKLGESISVAIGALLCCLPDCGSVHI